jgi:hypothetical protein
MQISLIHATRANPERALKTADLWLERATKPERVRHIFGVQADDTKSISAFDDSVFDYVTTPPPPAWASSSVANWNAAAHASTGDLLLMIADDLLPPLGWDVALDPLADIAEPAVAVYVPDQLSNDGLMRHPVINRAFLRKRGNVFDPDYYGVFCDNDFNVYCQVAGIKTLMVHGLKFHHEHPIGGAAMNPITELQNTEQAYAYGRKIYEGKWPELVWRKVARTHSVWIGGALSIMERLTLALLVKHGHQPVLWVNYDWQEADSVPEGVEIRIIPPHVLSPIRFAGKPHPSIPGGGIGSYAQWSDYFAMFTLSKHPGDCWIQLDVAAVKPIHAAGNTFTTYVGGIQTCCYTIEPEHAIACGAIIRELIEEHMADLDWHDTMTAVAKYLRDTRALITTQPDFKDCGCLPESPYNRPVAKDKRPALIHWSNATHHQSKREPVPGSLYAELIEETL